MKRIIIVFLFLLSAAGCEKILHTEDASIGKIEDYDRLVSAAGGVYGKLAEAVREINYFNINLNGDDLNYGHPQYEEYYTDEPDCWKENTYDIETTYTWRRLYQVIASANNILCQLDDYPDRDNKANEVFGEIYLIRAYCYFRLTRTYGSILLITNTDVDYNLAEPSFGEIYEFIEADLKAAVDLLPENNSSARIPYVTPHRGTAKALLAELYLSWAGYPEKDGSKYALAASEAGDVIDNREFYGFGLADDFAYLWDRAHTYNSESVFTVFFADPLNSTEIDEVNLVYDGMAYTDEMFCGAGTIMESPDLPCINMWFYPSEINFFNNYPRGYRKEVTFLTNIYVPNSYPYYPNIDTGYFHIDIAGTCGRMGYRKFFYEPYEIQRTQFYPGLDVAYFKIYLGNTKIYLFRYAHTLLTYAEAMARTGQVNAQAYECVNRIRRRARQLDLYSPSAYDLAPGLSPEAFADSVLWERAWELAGEPEGRWFDLVRLEKVEDLPQLRHPNEYGPPKYPITKNDYYFPIPVSDRNLNPNLGD
jgi:hypothetical protein